jgi:hypothetical protein
VIATNLAGLATPGRYLLGVGFDWRQPGRATNQFAMNSWKIWVYPVATNNRAPADVLVTSSWDAATAMLADGGKVLFLPPAADLDWASPPLDNVPVFWNRLMNPQWGRMLGLWCDYEHPALAKFPTRSYCDWQWTQIIRGVRAINLASWPRGLQPIVSAIDDWNRNWKLGVLFEARVGKGRLLMSAIDVEHDQNVVAQQLRRSLLEYMVGEEFQPATEVSLAQFTALRFDTQVMRKLGASAQAEGADAEAAIDGDPNTSWVVGVRGRGKNAPPPVLRPHTLTISFTNVVTMDGIFLMNRQNDRDHIGDVHEYELSLSDGTNAIYTTSGVLASTWSPQTIRFGRSVAAQQIKFTALSGFGADTASALAELAVSPVGMKLPDNTESSVRYQRVKSTSSDVDEAVESPVVKPSKK